MGIKNAPLVERKGNSSRLGKNMLQRFSIFFSLSGPKFELSFNALPTGIHSVLASGRDERSAKKGGQI